MTTLSIITINRNNAYGLKETMRSVLAQNYDGIEYIVVDGASSDGSVEAIKEMAPAFGARLKWVSEPDMGIYNAMNKGIRMSSGQYIQNLNSGDILASDSVTAQMMSELERYGKPPIIYGNEIKQFPNGKRTIDKCFAGNEITLLGYFTGSLNHDTAYIRADLFEKYGYYDENLKIVSDWKWFLQAIVLGGEKTEYVDIDMTIDDMTGISETNLSLRREEREKVLHALLPSPVLSDYENYSLHVLQMKRLKRHPWAYKIVWFIETREKAESAKTKSGMQLDSDAFFYYNTTL